MIEESRLRGARTLKQRHGEDVFKKMGKKAVNRHKFTPEEASAAAKKGWEKRKAKK